MMAMRVASLLLLMAYAVAVQAADAAAGLRASCAICHGDNGISRDPAWPHLAGQKAGYLRKQLRAFRIGERVDPLMGPTASSLSDTQIDELAAFYSGLPLPPATGAGQSLDPTTQPLVFCVRCHGADGISPNDIWPSLAGQSLEYQRRQVRAFQTGSRVDDMMKMWGGMVDAAQLEAILAHFARMGAR